MEKAIKRVLKTTKSKGVKEKLMILSLDTWDFKYYFSSFWRMVQELLNHSLTKVEKQFFHLFPLPSFECNKFANYKILSKLLTKAARISLSKD